MRKPLIFLAIALVVLVLGLIFQTRLPDLAGFRNLVAGVEAYRSAHPVLLAALYFAGYVAVAALSLPLAIWMTLGAGAVFGFWTGLLIASFAASIGATLAFLTARYLLRDAVAVRMSGRMKSVDEGLARDGAFYLFTLRLIPIIPFFAVNLLMGLTRIPARSFYLVSQVGMLPAAAIYVNAGTQIARLDSLRGIVSLPILLSLAALGLFPWLARWVIARIQSRKVYARWTPPPRFDRNLIVIGGGSAGLVSAYIAAAVKAKVTLIEGHRMGGDCLNFGCVPSKALIRSARAAHEMRHADRYGLKAVVPQVPFRQVMARIRDVIADIEPHDSVERYTGLGVEVIGGYARLTDPWTVEVTGPDGTRKLTTRSVILATGAEPFVPPLPGLDQTGFVTSDTLWDRFGAMDAAPARLAVLGGGPIGCELAQAFQRLGSRVILVEMASRLLIREDLEVSEAVRASLVADGVEVLTGNKALACGRNDDGPWIDVEAAGVTRRIAFDEMIVAVGRVARLKGFGLEDLSIPTGRVIGTNDYLETLYPNIFAAGDAAGPYQFTHVAAHQAWFASVNALFGQFRRFRADYRVIPAATFTDPEVARVGLNEAEAKAQGVRYEVTRYGIDDLDRAIADGSAQGFVKVLTVPGRDRILGATIVGTHAADLLAEFVFAMKQGKGLNAILSTIHIYPTLAEANKFAAGEWRRAHVNAAALRILSRYHAWRRG